MGAEKVKYKTECHLIQAHQKLLFLFHFRALLRESNMSCDAHLLKISSSSFVIASTHTSFISLFYTANFPWKRGALTVKGNPVYYY